MSLALKLDRIAARAEELRAMLSEGLSGEAYVRASKELSDIEPVVARIGDLRAAERAQTDAQSLLADPEMKDLAEAELYQLKDQIKLTVTEEGLRIELLESGKGTFFESGNTEPNGNGRELLMTIAEELGKVPNKISIEGHTDSEPFSGRADYTNWELSVDRANASRRLMQLHGLRADQVAQVRGFADQEPREGKHPSDPSNRRITLIVRYLDQQGGSAENLLRSLAGTEENKTPTMSGRPAGVPAKQER